MIKTKEIQNYKNYGTCVALSNGLLDLYVTVDVGPRIIYLARTGKENMMFNDIDRKTFYDVSSLYGEDAKWYIYGGHRLWASPEEFPLTYYPDNNKVVYEYTQNGVILMPPVQEVTGQAHTIEIALSETEPKVSVTHTIKNTGDKETKIAAWGLSVMDAGGTIIAPTSTEDTGFLPNRNIALWPYTDINDPRLLWDNEFIAMKHDSTRNRKLKVSFNSKSGKIAYINHDQAFIKKYDLCDDGEYPDFNTNCAFFSCNDFTESESLSPLKTLKKGDSLVHKEEWTLLDNVSLRAFTKKSILNLFSIFE